jgi:hypothetical protein
VIILVGQPLWLEFADSGLVEEIGGFYTTRWVLAASEDEASAGNLMDY